mgnify:CR=1 FL=1
MCLFREAELNCVSTNILPISELRQLEIGISTRRYLPAIGTAGLLRVAVSGERRVPAPPPKITAITLFFMADRLIIKNKLFLIFKHLDTSRYLILFGIIKLIYQNKIEVLLNVICRAYYIMICLLKCY